ncbi:hypothetical protein [Blastococcus sp. SYSU D00813]
MAHVEMNWHGEQAEAAVDAGIARGLRRGLDMIAERSQDYVLVHTGELKASQGTSVGGDTGSVYYTDSKAVGAHENLTVTPRAGKRAKFLELALAERGDEALDAIGDEVRKAL